MGKNILTVKSLSFLNSFSIFTHKIQLLTEHGLRKKQFLNREYCFLFFLIGN